ncbi:MAG: helix-turn-helix domain-containing protein [Gemmatimonas sp.]|nr:helix-turn-helix domain-containing protein [Gemmatimonas sp.]
MNTYLTKNEVASILQISTRTLEHMMADGEIPYFRIRRSIRFSPSVLDKLQQVKTPRVRK